MKHASEEQQPVEQPIGPPIDFGNGTLQQDEHDEGEDINTSSQKKVRPPELIKPKVFSMPPEEWTGGAENVVEEAEEALWGKHLNEVLAFLQSRGLYDATIEYFRLGFQFSKLWIDKEEAGLPSSEDNEMFSVPKGLLIPCIYNEDVIRLRVRSMEANPKYRYFTVQGSSNQPMLIGRRNKYVVVESDLDAFLLAQEAGDLVSIISLGSAQNRPDMHLHHLLNKASKILLALDYDEAGKNGCVDWLYTYKRAIRWPVGEGKDPGDAFGGPSAYEARDWIKMGLDKFKLELKRQKGPRYY